MRQIYVGILFRGLPKEKSSPRGIEGMTRVRESNQQSPVFATKQPQVAPSNNPAWLHKWHQAPSREKGDKVHARCLSELGSCITQRQKMTADRVCPNLVTRQKTCKWKKR